MIASLRPKSYQKYLSLPIIGPILDEFTTWSRSRGFTTGTMRNQLKDARLIDAYFQQTGLQRLEELSQSSFEVAWEHYRHIRPDVAGTIRQPALAFGICLQSISATLPVYVHPLKKRGSIPTA